MADPVVETANKPLKGTVVAPRGVFRATATWKVAIVPSAVQGLLLKALVEESPISKQTALLALQYSPFPRAAGLAVMVAEVTERPVGPTIDH